MPSLHTYTPVLPIFPQADSSQHTGVQYTQLLTISGAHCDMKAINGAN